MHPSGPSAKRAYATAHTGQVHYYDGGGEGIPLLMLHQSPTASTDFADTFPSFQAAGLRVIAMDSPGLGMSDAPSTPPTIADYAKASLAVLEHAGVARAHTVGHHTGVSVALAAAKLAPDRIDRMIFYGVPYLSPAELDGFWRAVVPRERHEGAFDPTPGGQHLAELFKRLEASFNTRVAQSMIVTRLMAGPTLWYAHNAALTHDMMPDFLASRRPTLLITHPGEMLDVQTRRAAAARSDAALVELERCAVAMYDAPEAFAKAVTDFLASG